MFKPCRHGFVMTRSSCSFKRTNHPSFMGYRQVVRHQILILTRVGSNPAIPVLFLNVLYLSLMIPSMMAQKIYPRSLRSPRRLLPDLAFYAEKTYTKVWTTTYQLLNHLTLFHTKNLVASSKRKHLRSKRSGQKQKVPAYFPVRWCVSNQGGLYQVAPVLFKFAQHSFSKKYNPMKAMRRVRRSGLTFRKSFKKHPRKTSFS